LVGIEQVDATLVEDLVELKTIYFQHAVIVFPSVVKQISGIGKQLFQATGNEGDQQIVFLNALEPFFRFRTGTIAQLAERQVVPNVREHYGADASYLDDTICTTKLRIYNILDLFNMVPRCPTSCTRCRNFLLRL